jgi:hypothetical protein
MNLMARTATFAGQMAAVCSFLVPGILELHFDPGSQQHAGGAVNAGKDTAPVSPASSL